MDKERMRTAEELLEEKGSEIFSVSPQTTIHEALKIMNEKKIGAVLIKENDNYSGIWTERDHMQDSILPDYDITTAKLGDFCTKKLITAAHDDKIHNLADKILGLRIRHLIIEREGKIIGLLSSGDIIRAGLMLRTEEWKELNRIVHLEYYEKWHFNKIKK
jgi:signal-transduction protein with cAMP-binding, CBS, and nucleotidyltransferase domain